MLSVVSMVSMVSMVSVVSMVSMVSVFVTKAAVLTIKDTAGVTESSLAPPGLVNALVLVAVGLLTGQAGGSVGVGGVGGVQVRAGEGDKVPV